MNKTQTKKATALMLFGALISGCGGGGGGSPASTAPVAPTGTVVAPSPAPTSPVATVTPVAVVSPVLTTTVSLQVPIVTDVPVPTYTAGSEELAAFNLLNAERSRCGFGKLAQNASLDLAAKSHADWLLRNGYSGHYQAPGTPLYSGVDPAARFISAGYASSEQLFSSTEVISGVYYLSNKSGRGSSGLRTLLAAPYHMLGMMRRDVDVGVALRSSEEVIASPIAANILVIDSGHKYASPLVGLPSQLSGQTPVAGSIRTYPCDGTVGVNPILRGEDPSPTPGRDLAVSPIGVSVGVVIDAGHVLAIKSAVMTHALTGENVALLPVNNYAANGVNVLYKNEGFITANAPLATFSQYKVAINGEDNGIAFTKTFAFTTGAAQ
jgi:Cysteine-rich secretory protein family